ncbi:triphosphoribosyl-dephospho-CoA synthase CitG [Alloiococcus sp. CFN-8]|uniref:triphosphoribosyl-dephospho-CoA synthase CitG n=1 Tax=Alloiococcus sp. CFN-8 TaxID=3416081 RepID=UPI003CE6E1E0
MSYQDIFTITNYARQAMLLEVSATPKPGLVDRLNSGAHKDMNYHTFLTSSNSVFKGLYSCALEGATFKENGGPKLLARLREIGKECENNMLRATGGVNTHKGLIFSFGILLAATARLMENGMKLGYEGSSEIICEEVKRITKGLSRGDFQDLSHKKKPTHGESIYVNYGIKGIRGEVEEGFPTVMHKGLPLFKKKDIKELGLNSVLLQVLMTFIAYNQDTNIIFRGGMEGLSYAQEEAYSFLSSGGVYNKEYYRYLSDLNDKFIEKNISPGGSADLLAVAIFLAFADGLL